SPRTRPPPSGADPRQRASGGSGRSAGRRPSPAVAARIQPGPALGTLERTRCPARPASSGRLVCLDQGLDSGVAGGPDSNSSRDKLCSALSGCFRLCGSGGLSGHAGGCKSCDFAAQPEVASAQITSASFNFTFDSLLL